jgi:hypothetical protein
MQPASNEPKSRVSCYRIVSPMGSAVNSTNRYFKRDLKEVGSILSINVREGLGMWIRTRKIAAWLRKPTRYAAWPGQGEFVPFGPS